MGYQKLKAEKYTNLGGINQKASTYVLGDNEFLDLENLDFQVPGGLNQRLGFTAAYAPSASFSIGSSETINAIWQITTPNYNGSTLTSISTLNFFGFNSGVAATSGSLQGATLKPWVTGQSFSIWDHSEFVDSTFYSNGINSFKSNAGQTTAYQFGMIRGLVAGGIGAGFYGIWFGGATFISAGSSATFSYLFAFLDTAGFVGMPSGQFLVSGSFSSVGITGFTTTTFAPGGATYSALVYGATAYVLFRNSVPGFPSTDYISLGTVPIGGTMFIDNQNYSSANQYQFYNPFPSSNGIIGSGYYAPAFSATTSSALGATFPVPFFWNISEVFANRMWIDANLNQIAFSELEQMENFLPENLRTVAANNFRFTAYKAYNQSLIIFCQKGVFRLTGDTPENFSIVEMSNEYGCLSDKAVIVFNERLWFLDYNSIVEFNGSNFTNVGNRVEGYLNRMNKSTVYRRACAIHYPERNEVWFSFPIDSSDINNITLVYDYLANGWTTFKGDKLKATAFAKLYFSDSTSNSYAPTGKRYYFGSIGGSMYHLDSQFKSDDSTAITLSYTTKYHNELGKSQTAQFRRYYLDLGSYTGPTLTFGNVFFANYVTATPYYTVAMNFNQWQDRIDFGIPAKALSIRTSIGVTTGQLTIYGYTVEFRFQRAV